jgi:hypothetical protein
MRLSADEFIRRFLSQIQPPQFRSVRYYGFFANSLRKEKLAVCRALLGLEDADLPYIPDMNAFLERQGIDYSLCPACGEGKMCCVHNAPSFHDPPQRYREAA